MADKSRDELKEYNENPFDPEKQRPEDIVRLFYVHDAVIIPVVSKRGHLIGIIRKKDVISELSDIERAQKLKTDKFITKLARKMTFEDLLPYGKTREFTVINIFGEVQGKWPRAKLFSACELYNQIPEKEMKIDEQKEEQILEWIIYLILEFIPRPLYAVNEMGNTIFYNSHFEDIFIDKFKKDEVDTNLVEKSLNDSDRNDLISGNIDEEIYFFNKDLDIYYEKIPMTSKDKKIGYLIFCDKLKKGMNSMLLQGADIRGMSLGDMLNSIERQIIAAAINEKNDFSKAAESLKINKQALISKAKKYGIPIENKKI